MLRSLVGSEMCIRDSFKCGVSHYKEYWYDCHGHLVCEFNNGHTHDSVRGARKVKCWYNGCDNGGHNGGNNGGNHGGHDNCDWDSWFEKCTDGSTYQEGQDVYVRVKAKKYHDIEWMELYCNGEKIKKEMNSPYEWCRPNGNGDHKLRRMRKGTYKLSLIHI